MRELTPIEVLPYMATNPDVRFLEMTGKLLINSGLVRFENYGEVPDHFEFDQASSFYTRVDHRLDYVKPGFEILSSEFVDGVNSQFTLTHTKHEVVKYNDKPRQTTQHELSVTADRSILKIRHSTGRYRKYDALKDMGMVSIPERTHPNHDLDYFTELVLKFIWKAGIVLDQEGEQNVA